MLAYLHVKLLVIVPAVNYNVRLCPQSHGGRFEVRGRHGKSVLTISGVRLSDLGRFDCEALSRIGGHQKSMFLDIERKYHKRLVLFGYRFFRSSLPALGKAANGTGYIVKATKWIFPHFYNLLKLTLSTSLHVAHWIRFHNIASWRLCICFP